MSGRDAQQGRFSRLADAFGALRGKGALAILAGSFLTKAAAFLGSIVLVRVMLVEEYGVLSYMENLYSYAYIFAGYGLSNAVFRYVVLKDTPSEKRGVFDYVVSRGTAFNAVFVALLAAVALIAPHRAEFAPAAHLLPIMLLAVPLQFLYDSGSLTLRAVFKNRAYAAFGVACVVVVYVTKILGASLLGLRGAALSWPVAYAIMCAAIILFARATVFAGEPAAKVPKEQRREMTAYSLQYMVTNGLWAVFMQNDILLLGMLGASPSDVAMYRVAYAIPAAVSLFSSSIGIFVAPYFVKRECDRAWVWRNYKRVLAVSGVSIGVVCLTLALFAEPLVQLVYGSAYAPAVGVMRILLLSAFLNNAVRYTAANLLAAMGRIRANLAVSVVGVVLQVILDVLLIPHFGMHGAACTSVAVYAIMALAATALFVWFYRGGPGESR